MASKVHLALFLLFACTVTVSAVEDNFQGENGEKFSQQYFNRSLIIFSNSSISKFPDIE